MTSRRGTWERGTKRITGTWEYRRPSDRFVIHLDSIDRVTGMPRIFVVGGDKPEFNGWKLVEEAGRD